VVEYVRLPGDQKNRYTIGSPGTGFMKNNGNRQSYIIEVKGVVQGVGFRPFIYKLAGEYGISGTVANTTEGVLINISHLSHIEVNEFADAIIRKKPPASIIEDIQIKKSSTIGDHKGFSIEKSRDTGNRFQLVSPDLATCLKCREDIFNRDNRRRYHYPFTNCTNCGPRFTIIKKMPYDRPNTTMDCFDMCPECGKEYSDPYDRRFHAQPNACKLCGPKLELIDSGNNIVECKDPLKTASLLLLEGKIIGLKSLGGFQIACDARSNETVSTLRSRKSRPAKPFAVMEADIEWINKYYYISSQEESLLNSPKAPIVLLRKKAGDYPLSLKVSLDNKYEGLMLPYTPIHHILFSHLSIPLVMTSGNLSEEPIASDNQDAQDRLHDICDYYLIHNRDIFSRYDDSVIRVFMKKEMVLRRARGYAPYPVKLDIKPVKKNILATGAQEKNTFTILTKNYGIISQHIGDLDTVQSHDFFQSSLENYNTIFGTGNFDLIAHDMHPDYRSTRIASSMATKSNMLFPVQHHKAHIASVIAENNIDGPVLGFSWDGTGYGEDGKIWGSEIFSVNRDLGFERIGHLREKILPGGDITIRKPYRMAAAYIHQVYQENRKNKGSLAEYIINNISYKKMDKLELDLICSQLTSGFNSPITTSMGRFFDAVSSLLCLKHIISFEGEAAIALEMAIDEKYERQVNDPGLKEIKKDSFYEIKLAGNNDRYILDDIHIFMQILEDLKSGTDTGFISFKFHNTLAQAISLISLSHCKNNKINNIALSGGVFQNKYLLDLCCLLLGNNGFNVYTNLKVPVNDGGISLGQAYLAANYKNKIRSK
jgi:hydrogenase maturation protein HypF